MRIRGTSKKKTKSVLLAGPPTQVREVVAYHGIGARRGLHGAPCRDYIGKRKNWQEKFEKRYAHTLPSLRAEISGPTRPKRTNGELTKHQSEGRALVDDLKVPRHLGEFVLIGGVVRLPFEALFRRKRLILAGLGVKLVIDRLKHFGDRGRFQEFAYARKRGHCGIEALGARL